MPEAVTSFGAVSHDGWLYVCGGHKGQRHEYSAPMVSGAFHRLRISDGQVWESLPHLPPAQGTALVARGNHVYRVGGMAAVNPPGEPTDLRSHKGVYRYDIGRRQWEDFVALPEPRSSHDATVLGDTLYVAGGWTLSGSASGGAWATQMLALDLRESRPGWKPIPQPFRRRALAVAGLHERLYFLGGIDASGDPVLAVDILDIRTGAWSKGPDLPPGPMAGFGCSAIAHAGRIYFSGLKGELHHLNDTGDAWILDGCLRHARFFHRLVPAGPAHLVALGGESSEGKRNDLERLALSLPIAVAG